MIRVTLPLHLRTLAQIPGEVKLEVTGPTTQRAVLDALEARYPMLRGTIRDHVTQKRRPCSMMSCSSVERLIDFVPHGHWKTTTFVAALRSTGKTARW